MRWMLPSLLCALVAMVGCSKSEKTFSAVGNKIGSAGAPGLAEELEKEQQQVKAQLAQGQDAANAAAQPELKAKDKPRKIRYTADMRLVVEDFTKAEDELDEARIKFKGDWAKKESSSAAGGLRSGTYRIRVPVEHFEAFRKAVAKVGEVERHTVESDDMTAQYYDLEAHIKNRQAARETLRELLKETGKKEMKHYLEVWDKLERMTDEINRAEGQLRLWANLTELTTVAVSMREKQKYLADKKIEDKEVPTFGVRAGETWRESLEAFGTFCQGIAIAAIAVTPWLPIPLIGVLFLWLVVRLTRSTKPAVMATPAAAEPKA
jgi:hypothetical protein